MKKTSKKAKASILFFFFKKFANASSIINIDSLTLINMFCRQVSTSALANRTRMRFTTVQECCRGYRKKGHECLKGEVETEEVAPQIYF